MQNYMYYINYFDNINCNAKYHVVWKKLYNKPVYFQGYIYFAILFQTGNLILPSEEIKICSMSTWAFSW